MSPNPSRAATPPRLLMASLLARALGLATQAAVRLLRMVVTIELAGL
jgi:hypothetical protein